MEEKQPHIRRASSLMEEAYSLCLGRPTPQPDGGPLVFATPGGISVHRVVRNLPGPEGGRVLDKESVLLLGSYAGTTTDLQNLPNLSGPQFFICKMELGSDF